MASIRLLRGEMREGGLPFVCARCGEPADAEIRRVTYRSPPWLIAVYFGIGIGAIIVYYAVRKRVEFSMPFCHRHRKFWSNRRTRLLFTFFGAAGLLVIGAVITENDRTGEEIGPCVVGSGIAGLIVWLFMAISFLAPAIWVTDFTDDPPTIGGVCGAFREAVLDQQDAIRERRREAERRPYEEGESESENH